jgi:uncharacterized membrane protein YhfC
MVMPFLARRWLNRKFQLPKGLFWKAGFASMLVGALHITVLGNIEAVWPQLDQWPDLAQSAFLGLVSGLFLELGRYITLDRFMRHVRNRPSALGFACGWAGVPLFFLGILTVISVFGMQALVQVKDIPSSFPQADTQQIQLLKDAQSQAQEYAQGNPLKALSPLFDNSALVLIDFALTLFMVLGLRQNQTRYAWAAVGIRTLTSGTIYFLAPMYNFSAEIASLVFAISALIFIFRLKKLPAEPV